MNRKPYLILRVAQLVFAMVVLVSCGGGDDDDIVPGEGEYSGPVYMAIRAVNENNESSVFSNELSTADNDAAERTLSFNEPNQQLNGECLPNGVDHYVVHFGIEPGHYTEEVSIDRNSTLLSCTPVGIDTTCGDISTCTISVSVSL